MAYTHTLLWPSFKCAARFHKLKGAYYFSLISHSSTDATTTPASPHASLYCAPFRREARAAGWRVLPLSDATVGRTASGALRNNCTHDRRGIHFVRHCRELSLHVRPGASALHVLYYGLRVRASSSQCCRVPEAQGSLSLGPTHCTYTVRVYQPRACRKVCTYRVPWHHRPGALAAAAARRAAARRERRRERQLGCGRAPAPCPPLERRGNGGAFGASLSNNTSAL